MKVLVTGGGFIRSHVVDASLTRGCDVTLLDRRAARRESARADVELLLGAVRDRELAADAVPHHEGQIAAGNHFMNNTYAITKPAEERFALMYNAEHGTRVPVVRVLNAYGERHQPAPVRKMVPTS